MSFTARRARLEDRLSETGTARDLSLARHRLHSHVSAAIERYVSGDCLDIGAGRSPYASLLEAATESVFVVDIEDRSGRVDRIADIQDMAQIGSGSFDSAICTQVLEHVPDPRRAVTELARVLRPGGHLVVSVPHLSAIHEAPTDFYRYTRYGLEALAVAAGLEVLQIKPTGGLVSFVAHGASVALLTTLGSVPGMFRVARALNDVLLVKLAGLLDRVVGMSGRYPCDYVLVALKPR
jgi:2-polyprenyl-3-methyl-5-hydroxy-6-metoxy-1,4-benzoquinol methylase